jgi:hypothetical protein
VLFHVFIGKTNTKLELHCSSHTDKLINIKCNCFALKCTFLGQNRLKKHIIESCTNKDIPTHDLYIRTLVLTVVMKTLIFAQKCSLLHLIQKLRVQGIPAFLNFIIRDSSYLVIILNTCFVNSLPFRKIWSGKIMKKNWDFFCKKNYRDLLPMTSRGCSGAKIQTNAS